MLNERINLVRIYTILYKQGRLFKNNIVAEDYEIDILMTIV